MTGDGRRTGPGLTAHLVVRRPSHVTAVDLTADAGEVVGLIGPNGAGKSTTLRALAGLVGIDEGEIRLGDHVLSTPGLSVAVADRDVGFVFQDHLLFPHLSVLDNVAFGPRARGASRGRARETARGWLERLEVADLSDRRPRALSGGQAQRVAIARALAHEPAMLLLDEPTAALDAAASMSLRTQLRKHLDAYDGVTVLVTHTALDAMVLADRLVVLDHGTVVQSGVPLDIAARPRTQHVAALVGLNLVHGVADHGVVALPGGGTIVAADQLSGAAFAAFSPSAVSLFTERPSGSPRNVWSGQVTSVAPHGDAVRVQLDSTPGVIADVTPVALATLRIETGSRLWASVKATEVTIYPA